MTSREEQLQQLLADVLGVLDEATIRWYLTGSHARNVYASPRTTKDFDIVVDVPPERPEELRALFEARGYEVQGPLQGDMGVRLVLALPSYEADLWLTPSTDYHREVLERAREEDYHGRMVRVIAPEDLVLRKVLNWQRLRGKDTDIDDAYQVLLRRWDDIDADRLIARAGGHRIEAAMAELVELVEEDLQAEDAAEASDRD